MILPSRNTPSAQPGDPVFARSAKTSSTCAVVRSVFVFGLTRTDTDKRRANTVPRTLCVENRFHGRFILHSIGFHPAPRNSFAGFPSVDHSIHTCTAAGSHS